MKEYKKLGNKDRNPLYHEPRGSRGDKTGLFKISLSRELQVTCTCARMHAATAHCYPLNFKQNQGTFGLKQPAILQTKTLFYPAVSVKYSLKPFLRFANDLLIIRYCYTALATYNKLHLLRYFRSRQANNVSNKPAFPTILIMKMVAFLREKS